MELVKYQDIPDKGNPLGLATLVPLAAQGDRGLTFGRAKSTGTIPVGKLPGYWTCPYNAKITGLYLNTDQGSYTIKFWKSNIGTPTEADSINQKGIKIDVPNTHLEVFNLSDFITTDVFIGDTFAVEIVEVSAIDTPRDISGTLLWTKIVEEA